MVGERTRTTVIALSLIAGFAVAPGFALAASADAQNGASVAHVVGQDDGGANTTLENLTVETLTLENVTIRNAMVERATVNGEERTNLTADGVTVENATLTNVTFRNITLTDRELLTAVVGQARATPEQNNSLESLDVSDRTINGLLIREATVRNASGVQLGEADGETERAGQVSAGDAQIIVENVTVESIEPTGAEDDSDASDESNADDESETETEGA